VHPEIYLLNWGPLESLLEIVGFLVHNQNSAQYPQLPLVNLKILLPFGPRDSFNKLTNPAWAPGNLVHLYGGLKIPGTNLVRVFDHPPLTVFSNLSS